MVRAGVVEEILYRGYPIERLQMLTGRVWPAALIPALVFIAVADIDWAVAGLIAVGSVIGAQLGATVGRRLSPSVLRGVIVTLGFAVGVVLLVKAFG